MTIEQLNNLLVKNSQDLSEEFKRLFHGRGGLYENWKFLTIDSIDTILSVAFYFECEKDIEDELIHMLKKFIKSSRHETIVLQRRYIPKTTVQIIVGELDDDIYALEDGVKIKLNLLSNQNSGYFPDMKNGRAYIKFICKNKKVLNLFSYTCTFSLSALQGEAYSVVNIDMSKNALNTGRKNHHLNNMDTSNVKFYPHNILKSFGRIKRESPFDVIIIDPPTFQKGSFEATKDYSKIIKKLDDISNSNCIVLSCLNSPDLDESFIVDIFKEFAVKFKLEKRLDNLKEFKSLDESRSLKNLVFKKM